jgi:hypothetical protein
MGVVSETEGTSSFQDHVSLARSLGDEFTTTRKHQSGHAPVSTCAQFFGNVGELGDKLRVVLFVGSPFARVASGENSRFPAQRVDFDAGIIRNRGQTGGDHDRTRLGQGVLSKRIEGFLQHEGGSDVVQGHQLEIGQQERDLLGLVSISGSEYGLQWDQASAASW